MTNARRNASRSVVAGDNRKAHRSASPLELLFDLTFVVAVAQIAERLAHGFETGHGLELFGPYLVIFFAIWWAWMNFTWFASGYDTDDALYRLLTLVQMGGVLVLAAGVPAAMDDGDYRAITIGYAIMRSGQIAHWLRVATDDPPNRAMALRNVAGFSVLQVLWLGRLLLPPDLQLVTGVLLALLDMSVPWWAERAGHASWHPGHIAERYGLFTIILLGESIYATTRAVQETLQADGGSAELLLIAASSLVIAFMLWWLYYLQPSSTLLQQRRDLSYVWGYGHYGIFVALATLGAGLEAAVMDVGGHGEAPSWGLAAAVSLPVSAFLTLAWATHAPLTADGSVPRRLLLAGAGGALLPPTLTSWLGVSGSIALTASLVSVLVAASHARSRRPARRAASVPVEVE